MRYTLSSILFSAVLAFTAGSNAFANELETKTGKSAKNAVNVVIDGEALKMKLRNKQAYSQVRIKGELYEVKISRLAKQCALYVCR